MNNQERIPLNNEDGNGDGNPGFVREDLCQSRRETQASELEGLRKQIIGAIAISTSILTLIQLVIAFLK